ncbi:hypothetical protein OH77DRAFT_1423728 [Trametes cingulata]|nr:hypothetical protein OH77DRAFT_1423728 [Trametes cingulata]
MSAKLVLSTIVAAVLAGSVQAFTGDATYYTPDNNFGACGARSQNSDLVVALSADQYAGGSNCFRHIGVNYQGKFVDATVVDLCPGCGSGSIDLSPAAFEELAPLSVGRLHGVTWNFE